MRLALAISAFAIGALSACGTRGENNAVETTVSDSAAGTISPSAASADARGTSMVRFVNAMPGGNPVSVSSDSVAVFSSVKFGDVTPYQELRENIKTFALGTPGAMTGTASNTETMRDGGRYTIFALPDRDGGASLKITRDELAPEAGKARIRVVHAAPGLDDVDVMMSGQKDALFDDVDYGSEAGFKDVAPGNASFVIRHKDRDLAVANLKAMTLKAGSAYTIVLIGRPGGKVEAMSFTDEMVGANGMSDTTRR